MIRVAVLTLCLWLLAACDAPLSAEDRPVPLLLISLAGYPATDRAQFATPNLDRLAAEGLTADGLVHAYPAGLFPTHHALATGLYTALESKAIARAARPEGPGDERIRDVLAWLDRPAEDRPDFITLYLDPGADAALGSLLRELEAREMLGQIHLVLVSSPGPAPAEAARTVYLDDHLPLDRVHVSAWGSSAHIRANGDMDADAIVRSLTGVNRRLRAWTKADTPEHYRFRDDPRAPDVIAEVDHGWTIAHRTEATANTLWGGDPQQRDLHGAFIGHGPAFPAGGRMPVFESLHLHGLIAHLLDLDSAEPAADPAVFAAHLTPGRMLPGEAPLPPAILFGERRPDTERALRLADAALNLHQARRTFTLTGVLNRHCPDEACVLELIDGEHRLEVVPSGFDIDPTLGLPIEATVHGQLEVDLPSRTWRLRSSAVLLQAISRN